MNRLKTILSIAFVMIVIFVAGMVAGMKVSNNVIIETMNHFKGIYVEGHQYFCAEERPDGK